MAAVTKFVRDQSLYKVEKPYSWSGPDMGFPKSNFELVEKEVSTITSEDYSSTSCKYAKTPRHKPNLTDIRAMEEPKPTIEEHGFCFLEHISRELPNVTSEADCRPYCDEMAAFLYVQECLTTDAACR